MIKTMQNIQIHKTGYNGIQIKTKQKVEVNKVKENNEVFPQLENKLELNIIESGKYTISYDKVCNKNIFINVAANLEVEIYEENRSKDKENINNVEILINENSYVYYLAIDKFNTSYIKRKAVQLENSKLDISIIGINKEKNLNEIIIDLDGVGSETNYKLISIAKQVNHSIYNVTVNNNAEKTSADIWQKAVVSKGGKSELFATGYIEKGADNAKNFQESRVLLLDEAAKGDASPLLLIEHHDVEAGHAASVSRVNEDDLYYLQSRGITTLESERLITIAFIRPLLDEIKDEGLREKLYEEILETLN